MTPESWSSLPTDVGKWEKVVAFCRWVPV